MKRKSKPSCYNIFFYKIKFKLTRSFVVVDIDSLELEVGIAVVGAGWIDSMLIRNHLPKLQAKIKQVKNTYLWNILRDECIFFQKICWKPSNEYLGNVRTCGGGTMNAARRMWKIFKDFIAPKSLVNLQSLKFNLEKNALIYYLSFMTNVRTHMTLTTLGKVTQICQAPPCTRPSHTSCDGELRNKTNNSQELSGKIHLQVWSKCSLPLRQFGCHIGRLVNAQFHAFWSP